MQEIDHAGDLDAVARLLTTHFPEEGTTVVLAKTEDKIHAVIQGPARSGFALQVREASERLGGHASGQDGAVRAFIPAAQVQAFLDALAPQQELAA